VPGHNETPDTQVLEVLSYQPAGPRGRRHAPAHGPLGKSEPAPTATRRGRAKAQSKRKVEKTSTRTSGSIGLKPKPLRSRKPMATTPNEGAPTPRAPSSPPTTRMVAFAEKLAEEKKLGLPAGYAKDFEICRRFLDHHGGR
jgi:DNA topoisomerase III